MKYTIRFEEPYELPRVGHTTDMLFPCTIVRSDLINAPEERTSTKYFKLKVGISWLLAASWHLQRSDLIKVLFEYGKRSIVQRVKDDMLTPEQELMLTSENYPPSCPFDPGRIPAPSGTTIEVDTGTESFSRAHASPPLEFDVFISHASEDKVAFVEPLAHYLVQKGLHVWFDTFTLKLGDRLRQSIDLGLTRSRYGIVVLSHTFFAKHWPQYELDGLAALEVGGRKVILPIWHGVSREDVARVSPPLADRVAVDSALPLGTVAAKILDVVRE